MGTTALHGKTIAVDETINFKFGDSIFIDYKFSGFKMKPYINIL